MTCSTSLSGKNRIVLIAGILMIATTLRVTFTGVIDHPAIIGLCANLTFGCPGSATFWYGT